MTDSVTERTLTLQGALVGYAWSLRQSLKPEVQGAASEAINLGEPS